MVYVIKNHFIVFGEIWGSTYPMKCFEKLFKKNSLYSVHFLLRVVFCDHQFIMYICASIMMQLISIFCSSVKYVCKFRGTVILVIIIITIY